MKLKSSFCIIAVLFFLSFNFVSSATANSPETRKDSPSDFDQFLTSCSQEEKSLLMKSLKDETKEITPESIKKALVYRAYSKATYPFRGHNEIDYHSIVQWAAGECEVPKEQVATLSTFFLERKIAERYFSELWNELSPEQKNELLQKIGESSDSKESILSILSRNSRWIAILLLLPPLVVGYTR